MDRSYRYQLFVRWAWSCSATRTLASTVGQREHRVQVELHDLGQIVGQQRETQEKFDERRLVGRRGSSEPGHKPAGLAGADELVGIDVRERRQPELRLADQFGEHAPGAECDERAEDRILDG